MIKYKLIEVYPNSLPLGTISKLDYSAYPKNWEPIIEPCVLYTTFDGVKRYQYQEEHWVINSSYLFALVVGSANLTGSLAEASGRFKIFSSKEKADEYIASAISLLVTEDGKNIFIGDSYWTVNTSHCLWSLSEQMFKHSAILEKNIKAFSTKILATEFIKMNEPKFSINQVLKFLEVLNKKNNIIVNYKIVKNERE